jgi:uncharacterized membrane protein
VVLDRGAGFQQRVKREPTAPAGVGVEPNNATEQPNEKGDVQVTITVAEDSALGEHNILVKGTPEKGEPTETQFKITVSAT